MKRAMAVLGVAILVGAASLQDAGAEPNYDHVLLPVDGATVQVIVSDDFDNDGNLDVSLVGLVPPKDLTVYFGDGSGAFPDSVTVSLNYYDRMTSGYIDDDEYPDLVAVKFQTGAVGVYLSNGDQTFASPIEVAGHTAIAYTGTVGYVNSDSYADVVVAGAPVVWYSGDGTGALTYEGELFGGGRPPDLCSFPSSFHPSSFSFLPYLC